MTEPLHIIVPPVIDPSIIGDDLESVEALLASARQQMNELKVAVAPISALKASFIKESEALAKQQREVDRKAKAAENAMFDATKAMRNIERTMEIVERKRARLEALKSFHQQSAILADEFDAITSELFWRDVAKPHQIVGMHHLARARRSILADAPRFGKTMTVLGACDMLLAKRILILTPNTVTNEFLKQVHKWAPHRLGVINLAGKSKVQRTADMTVMAYLPEYIVICNYEAWRKDQNLLDKFIDAKFDTVIIDEAHNLNNPKTNVFKGVEKVVFAENNRDSDDLKCIHCNEPVKWDDSDDNPTWGGSWRINNDFALGTDHCILNERYPNKHKGDPCSVVNVFPMTGTVIVNKPQDLWPLLNLVDRLNFPDRWAFERDYLTKDWDTGKWVFKAGGLDRLTSKLADKYIRRDRNNSPEVQIPTPEIVIRELTMDPSQYPNQAKVIKDLNQAIIDIAEDKKIGIDYVITLILRKRQAITWPHFNLTDPDGDVMLEFAVDESIKIDEIIHFENSTVNEWQGMVPEFIESGESVVIASQFVGTLAEIQRRCTAAGINCTNLGLLPVNERVDAAHAFNEAALSGKPGVMLGHYKVMGTGIPLDGANELIVLDESWNPAGNDQMYDRIVAMGKTDDVTVTILRVKDSIDEWMRDLNQQKRDVAEGFSNKMDIAADFIANIKKGLL